MGRPPWTIHLGVDPADTDDAVRVVTGEINRLHRSAIDQAEFVSMTWRCVWSPESGWLSS